MCSGGARGRAAVTRCAAILCVTAAVLLYAALCGVGVGGALAAPSPTAPSFKHVNVHDPSIVVGDDGAYYIFGSHMQAARSEDLLRWKMISFNAERGCKLFADVQAELRGVLSYAKTLTFWAPDVCRLPDGRWMYYYCACEGSSPLSMLGAAVADAPAGLYSDVGVLLQSGGDGYDATVLPNAVDPCVFFDAQGQMWMVYGSYSGGIYILRMDAATGLPLAGQGYGKKLLGKNHARIEAPYILYAPETGYYYLFLSFGGLAADGGYNIRVCRSRAPDGPYVDALGQDMTACGGADGTFFHDADYAGYGVKLMGGHTFTALPDEGAAARFGYVSPGHSSALFDARTGRYYLVFHTRFIGRGEAYSTRIHAFWFNEDDWIVVSPYPFAGEGDADAARLQKAGVYKVILHGRDINVTPHASEAVTLLADGGIVEGAGAPRGAWVCHGETLRVTLDGKTYSGRFTRAWEPSLKRWTTAFTALSADGEAIWGSRSTADME